MNAPSTIAPHLTREQAEYMALRKPVTLESLTADLLDCLQQKRTLSDDLARVAAREADIRSDIHALMQETGVKTAETLTASGTAPTEATS